MGASQRLPPLHQLLMLLHQDILHLRILQLTNLPPHMLSIPLMICHNLLLIHLCQYLCTGHFFHMDTVPLLHSTKCILEIPGILSTAPQGCTKSTTFLMDSADKYTTFVSFIYSPQTFTHYLSAYKALSISSNPINGTLPMRGCKIFPRVLFVELLTQDFQKVNHVFVLELIRWTISIYYVIFNIIMRWLYDAIVYVRNTRKYCVLVLIFDIRAYEKTFGLTILCDCCSKESYIGS